MCTPVLLCGGRGIAVLTRWVLPPGEVGPHRWQAGLRGEGTRGTRTGAGQGVRVGSECRCPGVGGGGRRRLPPPLLLEKSLGNSPSLTPQASFRTLLLIWISGPFAVLSLYGQGPSSLSPHHPPLPEPKPKPQAQFQASSPAACKNSQNSAPLIFRARHSGDLSSWLGSLL